MSYFLSDNFLLEHAEAQNLYHGFAKQMPIIDYHNHLSPKMIAEDYSFATITEAWLSGDHYKWRAMRTNGILERFCTGDATDWEKFEQWSVTVPYTIQNPLFHWTHLELQRYFGVNEILNPQSARKIFDLCNEQLKSAELTVQKLLQKMNVQYVGTTDDPLDDLSYHQQIKASGYQIKVHPSFRPDKAISINNVKDFNSYLLKLAQVSTIEINNFNGYLEALKNRHDYFATNGCTVSDHGVEQLYAENYTSKEIEQIFEEAQKGNQPNQLSVAKFKSSMLTLLAEWGFEKNWVQQYHMGPIRNNNTRMFNLLGADTGWDSMGNSVDLKSVSLFLDRLDVKGKLAKTILYSINPNDNDALASLVGNFNDGTYPGKVQLGAAWWFNDQLDGMIQHMKSVGNMGLLSRFVGMLTDSRSFLSFPRHEYFRRILCNFLGTEMNKGRLPQDENWIGSIVQDICYNNAKQYFNL